MDTDVFANVEKSQVTRRRVISGIAGVGAAVIAGTTLARAQESTPEAGTTEDTDTDTTSPDEARGANYQTFLTKLAAELSLTDTTALDTDIRDALKAMVDDVLAAGDLAANDATDIKTAIDESVSPIKIGFFSHDGFGAGPGGMGGRSNSRDTRSNGKPGDDPDTDSDTTATPTT